MLFSTLWYNITKTQNHYTLKGELSVLIIQLEEAIHHLEDIREDVKELGSTLHIEELERELENLEAQTSEGDFWNDAKRSAKILKEIKARKSTVEDFRKLESDVEDTITLAEMGIEEADESICEEVLSEVARIEKEEDRIRIEVLLCGEYDHNNAIISFHPGAGGTEAQDWASMLYRMYNRWAEKSGFTVKLLDWLDGDEAGLKSATILVEGNDAYGYLKSENGVHRLVRVSPFDASGRRQTSFASVEVMPELDDSVDIEINEADLEITAHRSSGAGGQHINKTDSAIRILHKPTGIVVGCQTERSQLQNKETAMRMLKAKLVEIKEREHLDRIEDIQGEKAKIEWGAQIRSYVFMPYTLVKDTRTGCETADVDGVMDGDLDAFINSYLKMNANK